MQRINKAYSMCTDDVLEVEETAKECNEKVGGSVLMNDNWVNRGQAMQCKACIFYE